MNWFVYIILIASAIFCGASDCKERAPDRHDDCQPELTSSSDPIPEEELRAVARNVSRGKSSSYVCQILKGQRVTYREVDQAELIRQCNGIDRTRGCYVPGLGEHTIYVIRDPPGWVVRHELYHLFACIGPGLCTENESHTWMGHQGAPGVPENRKPPD